MRRLLFQLVFETWQLHLRRVGVEPQPDLVRSIPKDDTGGSPSKEKDEKDGDDQPKDNGGNPESTSEESQLPPAPESSESHGLDDQLLINAKICSIGREDAIILTHSAFLKNQQTVATRILLQSTWEFFIFSLLPFYMESLYITSNNVWKFRQLV